MENNQTPEALALSQTAEVNSQSSISNQAYEQQFRAITRLIARIRESLDIETTFNTTVAELRQLLNTNRVGVFRFINELDWQGEFVYEDVSDVSLRAIHVKIYDPCFSNQSAAYQQGRIKVSSDIYQDCSHSCYIDLLENFQVRACIVAPLLKGEQLWGLLCIHQCSIPRVWEASEIEFVKQIAQHLGIVLQHTELLVQARLQVEKQKALTSVIARIRESLDLQTIFKNTATEVRHLLACDRVGVFRFDPSLNWEGEFVSESVAHGWNSAMAAKVYDHCFSEQFAPQYELGKINLIPDIYQGDCSPCHIEILEKFQVRANLVAPLLKGKQLWGLLCIHQCNAPRYWEPSEIDFVQQIAAQLSVAIQQAEYLKQTQIQTAQLAQAAERERAAERQKSLAKTIEKIRQTFDLETIFHTATHEVRKMLSTDRAVIYKFNPDWSGEFVVESTAPGWDSLLELQWQQPEVRANASDCGIQNLANSPITDTYLQQTQGGRFGRGEVFIICNDIYKAEFNDCYIRLLEIYQARAYIIIAIYHGQKLWGLLAVYSNSAPRQWQDEEVYLLTQISTQLGVALQQAEYIQQVKAQTAQLEKAASRQRALATTVDKIRQSLDIKSIFQATTQEVRGLLNVERVAIYRFYSDWSGEFVADSIVDGWTPVVKTQPIIEKTFLEAAKAGQYPRNETFVPISQGEKLWGLLVAYQNSQPRYWEEEEVNLLAQVAVQLGVALQQAELLQQTRLQKEKLNEALSELQQTQTQLIQGEKMAGLGQLVAGIAHEINNPINFIYGNITHVSEYTLNLLDLLSIYKKQYPEPGEEIEEKADNIDLDYIIEDLPKTLKSMHSGAERISQLVESLRTFSRLDHAEMKLVDIHEGIDSTLLILQHRLRASNNCSAIKVIKKYGDLPKVECYAAQMNQVFLNILGNAIDALETEYKEHLKKHSNNQLYTPEIIINSQVVLNERILIRIYDNGCGIPEHIRSRVFDPFFTTKEPGKGTGLGLSISYQIIVEKHSGKIECFSEPGKGTGFWIEIPIRCPEFKIPDFLEKSGI